MVEGRSRCYIIDRCFISSMEGNMIDTNNVLHLLFLTLPILVVTLCLSKCSIRMLWPAKDDTPPGSFGLPIIGETLSFFASNNTSKGFYEFVRARRLRHGNCFKANILGRTHVFVSSTEAAKFVLSNDLGYFSKNYLSSISELLGEHSVLRATNNHHRFLRHHMGSLLTTDNMASFIRVFDKLTIDFLSKWKEQKNVVVLDEALKITFRAMCRMLMSLDEEDELEPLQKDIFLVCEGMLAIPLKTIPCTTFFRGLQARQRIMGTLKRIIDSRRTGLETHNDLIQALMIENVSTPRGTLTDAQIQDNILTLIIAGQITTASALAWMVKYLDENQDIQEKLRNLHLEIAAENLASELRMQTLNEMSYASKVVKETLRMATIVSWFPMIAMKDCNIEGYNYIIPQYFRGVRYGNCAYLVKPGFQVKKGWVVNVDARCIHNDETIYEDPTKFLPSRFNEDPKPYSFLVFGTGATSCLGKNLAKAMMMIFLHHLVTSYRWKVTNPDSSIKRGALFPQLKSGCPIFVAPI